MDSEEREKYSELGRSILARQDGYLSTQLAVLQSALMSFARDHWKDIQHDCEIRGKFTQMCVLMGLEPLDLHLYAMANNSGSKDEQFYIGLAIRIVEVCQHTRDVNGGLISMKELLSRLKENGILKSCIKTKDIEQSIGILNSLGKSYEILNANKKQWVKFLSASSGNEKISDDQMKVFEACSVMGGYVTYGLLMDNYGWDQVRCKSVLDEMILDGFLWIDMQGEDGVQFWEPSWISRKEADA